jgi:serine phosphatase RsbU (regulator of sigma subunit)
VRLVVGDVCGHGPDEAAVGVAMRVAWRSLVVAGVPPDQLLHRLERVLELERHVDDLFTTVCDVVLLPDLAGAEVRVAGHPAPLRIDETLVGSQPLDERGPPLGMFRDAEWNANEVDLGTDWTWLLYTDGLIEGRDGTSEERLADVGLARLALEALPQASDLGDLADRLRRDAERANGGELSDDVAMCLLSPAARWRR